MALDVDEVLNGFVKGLAMSLPTEGASISQDLLAVINNKSDMADLVRAVKEGDISQQEFADEIEREKAVLEAEIIQLEIAAKATIQHAVNQAISSLTSSIKVAL
ncbi:hypothetical protein C2869_14135 [Saccharobesus litoralis]|uniref:Uncharacterized protein n=1 Tax=Saccharobesus litoralis TaxID=2172099 RepID=A0A2S0VTF8_9ALTE|nr:hypothetical protein [Saccharobesus litoralis]AWB67508.1 hypothetical protein C2869_14135 [Saccharobesus litoralis]